MILSTAIPVDASEDESRIARILQYHYGDGLVYLPRGNSKELLSIAKDRGFIDSEGYITRKGRALLIRYF